LGIIVGIECYYISLCLLYNARFSFLLFVYQRNRYAKRISEVFFLFPRKSFVRVIYRRRPRPRCRVVPVPRSRHPSQSFDSRNAESRTHHNTMRSWSAKCAYYVCRTNILSARKTASACRPPGKSFRHVSVAERSRGLPLFLAKVCVRGRPRLHGTLVPGNCFGDAVELLRRKFFFERFSARTQFSSANGVSRDHDTASPAHGIILLLLIVIYCNVDFWDYLHEINILYFSINFSVI